MFLLELLLMKKVFFVMRSCEIQSQASSCGTKHVPIIVTENQTYVVQSCTWKSANNKNFVFSCD